jgi:hypothetical protein
MVDKKVSQKQQVKQTVKVIIGDVAKKRVKRKRAVKTKGLTSTVIQPSARGAFSGGFSSYVPSSNVPFSSVAQAPISLALETRVKQLELKADNPALNLSGNTSVKAQYRLENKSMASNEAFPYDEREPYIDDMRKAELKRKEQILKEQSQITRTEGVFNQMKKLINESPKEGGFFYMRKQTEAKKLPALELLGQVNVNMLDRNIPFIDDVRKAELKAKEKAFKKARQESIKRQVLNVMDRATTVPALPPKTKKKLLVEDF